MSCKHPRQITYAPSVFSYPSRVFALIEEIRTREPKCVMEHRHGKRVLIHLPIRLLRIRSSLVSIGRLTNLSLSGAFIADFELRPLSRIKVSFESPVRANQDVVLMAFVTRRSAEGVGIEWCDWGSPALREMLRAHGCAAQRLHEAVAPIQMRAPISL